MGRRIPAVAGAFAVLAALAVPAPAAGAAVRHDRVVSDAPAPSTPAVLDGEVRAVARVGNRVVVGGTFDRVREAGTGAVLDRAGLFAFDPASGSVMRGFAPRLGGRVDALAGAPGGGAVFAGGRFPSRLAKLDMDSGRAEAGFRAEVDGSSVEDLAVAGGRLYVGGGFAAVNHVPRSSLAVLDPVTGTVDPGVDVPFTAARQGRLRIEKLDVTPDGATLVAGGTFTRVAGEERNQLAVVDVGSTPARLSGWRTDAYRPACSPAFDTYVRDVAVDPGGDWFVVVTTGARGHTGLCDTAARFELAARQRPVSPTWVDYSGGDSFTAVAVTGPAVYVAGHMRWMNNPWGRGTGRDAAPGPGAVTRSGIAALDPQSGVPLSW
ncbi:MAG: PKD domain containing protein, partial [Acidimicrobiia bacterium]